MTRTLVAVVLAVLLPVERSPLDLARVLAERYPQETVMSYIPALSWSGALRLTAMTGEKRWEERARAQVRAFVTGEKSAISEPYLLTSLAGHLALFDAGEVELARKAADFILAADGSDGVRFGRGWTDDMFMAASLLARVGSRSTDDRYTRATGRLLTSYVAKLQRPDGLFIHAADGPHAWGRGNGFAAFGLVEALTHLDTFPERPAVLDAYRRQMRALTAHQSDDGAWRQVVDEPSSYRELTVTAMTVAAMARGVRKGWLDRGYLPHIERGWDAVLARVAEDGTVKDVCAGTGAGPTKDYYLNRPIVNGPDDRGGAMALVAAMEMEELKRETPRR